MVCSVYVYSSDVLLACVMYRLFFFSSRRRQTRCALVLEFRRVLFRSPGKLAPVFIEASLDQTHVYVQAQAILTLRIYHSVSLYDDSSLTQIGRASCRDRVCQYV